VQNANNADAREQKRDAERVVVVPETEELETPADTPEREPRAPRRWWRGLTGSLAVGLVVLAVLVLGSEVLALIGTAPGPGVSAMVGHPLAAIVAMIAQRFADRRRGPAAAVAGLVVLGAVAAILVIFWWF
jgi:predicted lipid-binding transport protein (Tim44 family)